jgi:hypothetical protein
VETSVYNSKSKGQVEIFNNLLQRVIKGLLITKSKYAWGDVLFLATMFLNASTHRSTRTSPFEAVYGRVGLQSGPVGLSLRTADIQSTLIDASLVGAVKQLRVTLDQIATQISQNIDTTKRKWQEKANRTRVTKKEMKEGDIVFIRDNRLPVEGTNKKLAPRLQKSPFIVTNAKSHIVYLVRMTDRFETRVSVDDCYKYEADDPKWKLHHDIPKEVLVELGRPISTEMLIQLERADTFPLLMLDRVVEHQSEDRGFIPTAPSAEWRGVLTRAQRRKRALEQEAGAARLVAEEEEESEEETEDTRTKGESRSVRFSTHTEQDQPRDPHPPDE